MVKTVDMICVSGGFWQSRSQIYSYIRVLAA